MAGTSAGTSAGTGPAGAGTVLVTGLPPGARADSIRAHFGRFGEVRSSELHRSPTHAYARIEYASPAAAEEAARARDHRVDGARLRVVLGGGVAAPANPFPGMHPLFSPLREVLLAQAMDMFVAAGRDPDLDVIACMAGLDPFL